MPKFVEDASVALGDASGPFPGVVIARGFFARMLYPGPYPARGDRLVYRRVKTGKRWSRTVRVASFYPLPAPHREPFQASRWFWFSEGYYEWSRLEWIGLWFRAMRTKLRYGGARIPRARVVNIGAKHGQDT